MKAVAVICEYNPFHNGHLYQINLIRERFPNKPVLCLMSGNFVQRASLAVADKYTRARAAVLCGADLVLELPYPFSMLSAEGYALSALRLIEALGCVETLAFGSEAGELRQLEESAALFVSPEFEARMKETLTSRPELSYPRAREAAARELKPEVFLPVNANDILSVEYLKAKKRISSEISFFTHSRLSSDEASNATDIRKAINDSSPISQYVPENSLRALEEARPEGLCPIDINNVETLILYALRTASPGELRDIYACRGLEHNLISAARQAPTMEKMLELLRSKSYTDSRLRRASLSALLRLRLEEAEAKPGFSVVLAANETGRELLREIKRTSKLPVFTKPSHALRYLDAEVSAQVKSAFRADSVYLLGVKRKSLEGDYFIKKKPFILGTRQQ